MSGTAQATVLDKEWLETDQAAVRIGHSDRTLQREAKTEGEGAVDVPLSEKLWPSIDEAPRLSGLARGHLKRLCREQRLVSRKSAGWKILRRSLDEFEDRD